MFTIPSGIGTTIVNGMMDVSVISGTTTRSKKSILGGGKLKFNNNPMRPYEIAKSMHLNDKGTNITPYKLQGDISKVKIQDINEQEDNEI